MSAIISRVLATRPPGVFSRRITTSAFRSAATASASFRYLALAGPIAPSISMVKANRPLSSPVPGEGLASATARRAKASSAARANITLKAPNLGYMGSILPTSMRCDFHAFVARLSAGTRCYVIECLADRSKVLEDPARHTVALPDEQGRAGMKITINIDCTPAEAREMLGLPDLQPLQNA